MLWYGQAYYRCNTCGYSVDTGKGVCEPCARLCHVGHALSDVAYGGFYCDCGVDGRCGVLAAERDRALAAAAESTTGNAACTFHRTGPNFVEQVSTGSALRTCQFHDL